MCHQLQDIRTALCAFATGFDPAVYSLSDVSVVVTQAAAIESAASALKALAAARLAKAKEWKESGHRNAADAISKQTGMTPTQARGILDTGQTLADQPELAQAALSGDLSPTQTSLIAQAAQADPEAAPRLIEQAKEGSVSELKQAVAATIAANSPDPEGRYRAIHRRRRLRTWTDQEGAWHLQAYGTPSDGAQIDAALAPIRQEIFKEHRQAGTPEPLDAYAFDALVTMAMESAAPDADADADADPDADPDAGPPDPGPASPADPTDPTAPEPDPTGPTDPIDDAGPPDPPDDAGPTDDPGPVGAEPTDEEPEAPETALGGGRRAGKKRKRLARRGAPTKIIFRIDMSAWQRGYAGPGEVCEISGYGPVPVSAVDEALGHSDPMITAVLTRAKALHGVVHFGRSPTAFQQTALEWIYPNCAVLGCTAKAHLERDHQIDWADTRVTVLERLDLLCHHHHALKTRKNWALVEGRGKRPFVPPDDPRHPMVTPGPKAPPSPQPSHRRTP